MDAFKKRLVFETVSSGDELFRGAINFELGLKKKRETGIN
jgi:hypothetical protein